MINLTKRLIKIATILSVLMTFCACSKEPPPPTQPPVVINLTNSSQIPSQMANAQAPANAQTQQQPVQNLPASQVQSATPQISQQVATTYQSNSQVQPAPAYQAPYQAVTANSYPVNRSPSVPTFEIEHLDEASFFNTQIHEMAMQLLKNFRGDIGPDGPVAVTTFVDLNNLYKTSPFGRYIAEQLMGELQRAGFNVVEVRKTDALMIKPRFGEYGLSREIQEIARQSSARYVLAGTYVTRGKYILVNARLISNDNNLVASSGLKILRRDPFLEKMLWPTSSPENIPAIKVPVKELGTLTEVKIMSGS